ncbi:hypothetical protein [Caulobacter sp. 17J65-9]|uniref:hypothetical protein n=1 Tax=Caulobacter sp. 17J65-9 TaxID=2709382 RepID=UPI0013C687B0|nr:hypothetical protein [Caulobacter sp. 17J65-9]NEX92281.1 hypothetical protein [Caulobacter sp. 17J65-9]
MKVRAPAVLVATLAVSGCGMDAGQRLQSYREQQARDAVADYGRARAANDVLGMCVKSSQVSAAYLDAHDTASAAAWRAKNAEDCAKARAQLAPDDGDAVPVAS